jgi:hypothetical protein
MAGQPKNKVTRAEQGKRRRGNTPKLVKNLKQAKVPHHKQTLFGRFVRLWSGAPTAAPVSKTAEKKAAASATPSAVAAPGAQQALRPAPRATAPAQKNMAAKPRTRTSQHKG